MAGSTRASGTYALAPLQSGMLYHSLRAPGSGVDIEQLVCTLPEPLDADAMERAWRIVVARHDVLRTCFRWEGLESPRQQVAEAVELEVERADWRSVPAAERESRFAGFLRRDRARGFDLATPPLLRVTLQRWAEAEYRLVWTFHHALLDGRSFPVLLREVFAAYDAILAGGAPVLEPAAPYR
ncbi:MAG TPA: condensation domain-containing protein, partial [Longimicrobiales bacterium]|nr:condensation domain-containing protein [Longimicrobiales bacterium]